MVVKHAWRHGRCERLTFCTAVLITLFRVEYQVLTRGRTNQFSIVSFRLAATCFHFAIHVRDSATVGHLSMYVWRMLLNIYLLIYLLSCWAIVFLSWPWTLTYDPDLRTWPRECQDEPISLRARSTVIYFNSYYPHKHTNAHSIDCSTWGTKVVGVHRRLIERLLHLIRWGWQPSQFRARCAKFQGSVSGPSVIHRENVKT